MTRNPPASFSSSAVVAVGSDSKVHEAKMSDSDASGDGEVDLLILGAGWTGSFLIPVLNAREGKGEEKIRWAATTRSGKDSTIPFTFDPDSQSKEGYERLPKSQTVLITFPLRGTGQSKLLTDMYNETHDGAKESTNWIQLGATTIWKNEGWADYRSPYSNLDERAVAEDELLVLYGDRACTLNLAGLYGGQRQLRHWLPRVARSKEDVAGKGAVHMVHGNDVSRAIIGAHLSLNKKKASDLGTGLPKTVGGRHWPITDLHCYDWWDLFIQFGSYARENAIAGNVSKTILKGANPEELRYEKWVLELMEERGIRALPRDKEGDGLGRLVDGRAFWGVIGSWPVEGRADRRE